MRLIDADEAIRRIEANMRAYYEESNGGYYLAEAAVDEIDAMPTVDAEPVKHGKWNKRTTIAYCRNGIFIDYDEYLCSECQKVTEIKENYCSNCGAKMDLEGEQVETHQVGPCCVGGKKRE